MLKDDYKELSEKQSDFVNDLGQKVELLRRDLEKLKRQVPPIDVDGQVAKLIVPAPKPSQLIVNKYHSYPKKRQIHPERIVRKFMFPVRKLIYAVHRSCPSSCCHGSYLLLFWMEPIMRRQ